MPYPVHGRATRVIVDPTAIHLVELLLTHHAEAVHLLCLFNYPFYVW